MRLGLDLASDLGTPRLSWGRLATIVGRVKFGDALWDALTDGAPSVDQRLAQATEVGIRRLQWMWADHENDPGPYPEPLPLPADQQASSHKAAAQEARQVELVDQLLNRRAQINKAELGPEREETP